MLCSLHLPSQNWIGRHRRRAGQATADQLNINYRATMSLLEVEHLRKKYGDFVAVDDLSFEVDRGEILGLLGPNGAGKTTAMMILAGLRTADGGEVRIGGQPYTSNPAERKRAMGVVPQELAIYPDLTGWENLSFFGSLYGFTGARLKQRVEAVLDVVGLTEFAGQLVRTYSGGMKRRLNFSVGILHEPQLVILDEPTVGVDPQSRSHLLDCVRELAARGVALIYCSHYMEEIESLCRRVAIMDHGKLLAYGVLDELLDRSRQDLDMRLVGWSEALKGKLGGLVDVESTDGATAHVTVHRVAGEGRSNLTERLGQVMAILQETGGEMQTIQTKEYNLERLFLEKTGRRLRD
ncbi:MAG: ABC transporter ATP-binding protein [Planctomycetaceae bacterium]|nr:MAG: ABC transporter ATP-binding protein [Planctomycetaceae bacterium]